MIATHGAGRLKVGVDLVFVGTVEEALADFGDRYLRRVFAPAEIAYATSTTGRPRAERLAARFAAKEATMKALDLSERGVAWTDVEVERGASGACRIVLHGEAEAAFRESNIEELAVSLGHEGDYAVAVVVARAGAQENQVRP